MSHCMERVGRVGECDAGWTRASLVTSPVVRETGGSDEMKRDVRMKGFTADVWGMSIALANIMREARREQCISGQHCLEACSFGSFVSPRLLIQIPLRSYPN